MGRRKQAKGRLVIGAVLTLGIIAAATPASAASYSQPVWFTWNKAVLDVLILPPGHGQIVNGNGWLNGFDVNELNPYENSYLRAIEQGIADWDHAINTYGASWLQNGLVTNAYVVGRDSIPTSALLNPEIVIATDETKGVILGMAVSSRPCIVDNSKLFITSFTEEDMYSIGAHEYGHCLGLDHSYGSPDDGVITHDVIYATYQDTPGAEGNHRHCMSNLNVKGLERVFGALFGQPSGGTVTMSPTSYARISC